MSQNAHKKALLMEHLSRGLTQILVNTTLPGVQVPDEFQGSSSLLLNLSYRFGTPLEIKEDAIYADLSFGGVDHSCVLPWERIFAMRNLRGTFVMFREGAPFDNLPGVILDQPNLAETTETIMKPFSGLSLLKNDEPELEFTPPRTGHLKLVH